MKCRPTHELVARLEGADGWLRRLAAERHIRRCRSCRDRLAGLTGAEEVIRRYFEIRAAARKPSCPTWEELVALVEGDLLEADRSRVAEHAESCRECSRSIGQLRMWSEGLGEAHLSPSKRMRAEARRAWAPAPTRRWRLVAYPAAAGVALGAVLLTLPRKPPDTRTGLHAPESGVSAPARERQLASQGVTMMGAVAGVRERSSVLVAFRYRLHGSAEIRELEPPFQFIPSLSSKDDYALRVRPPRDGWLYIFQIDSRGRLAQLFPSARYGTAQNPVKAGVEYWIPADNLWYYLDETEGVETIYVAFSSSRRDQWEELARRAEQMGDKLAAKQLSSQLAALASADRSGNEARGSCVSLQFAHRRNGPSSK